MSSPDLEFISLNISRQIYKEYGGEQNNSLDQNAPIDKLKGHFSLVLFSCFSIFD